MVVYSKHDGNILFVWCVTLEEVFSMKNSQNTHSLGCYLARSVNALEYLKAS